MRYFIFLVMVGFLLQKPIHVFGSETSMEDNTYNYDDINYDEIQSVLDDILESKEKFNFGESVGKMMTGGREYSFQSVLIDLKSAIKNEFSQNKNMITRLISIAIIAALFTNFTNVFQNNQVAETGFYVTYLLLFSVLTTSFYVISNLAGETLSKLLDFMKVLIPTFFMSVAFSAGTNTSLLFYESTLFLITLVDFILIRVILPLINIYFVLVLANNLSKEDMLSKLIELLELMIGWTLKTLLGAVIGFNGIQGLVIPVADKVKNSLLMKTAGAIPGIGNALSSVTESIFGAGVLVKNAIGVVGLVAIIIICAIPLAKIVLFVLIYKFGVAIVQPISDKRILNCMNASAQAARLLLFTVSIGMILFFFTIAIISATTNFRL